jgi:hypothetical protein
MPKFGQNAKVFFGVPAGCRRPTTSIAFDSLRTPAGRRWLRRLLHTVGWAEAEKSAQTAQAISLQNWVQAGNKLFLISIKDERLNVSHQIVVTWMSRLHREPNRMLHITWVSYKIMICGKCQFLRIFKMSVD